MESTPRWAAAAALDLSAGPCRNKPTASFAVSGDCHRLCDRPVAAVAHSLQNKADHLRRINSLVSSYLRLSLDSAQSLLAGAMHGRHGRRLPREPWRIVRNARRREKWQNNFPRKQQ
jgi:hypothetical protein